MQNQELRYGQFCSFSEFFSHKFKMNQAINSGKYVIYWYKSIKVGIIQNSHVWPSYGQKMAHAYSWAYVFLP